MKIDVTFKIYAYPSSFEGHIVHVVISSAGSNLEGWMDKPTWSAFRDLLQPCKSADFVIKEETDAT